MSDLTDRNVVVTGGTSGIGLATAVQACAAGANVWAIGRSVRGSKELEYLCTKCGLSDAAGRNLLV